MSIGKLVCHHCGYRRGSGEGGSTSFVERWVSFFFFFFLDGFWFLVFSTYYSNYYDYYYTEG